MRVYKPNSVHPMNRTLSDMAQRYDVIHDVDCIYRNTAKNFWCVFEWKNPGEQMSSNGTLASLQEVDQAFCATSDSYRGLFIVRLGFSIDAFPLDDTQQVEIVHLYDGILLESETYTAGARTAIQHILDHGRLQ